MFGATDAAFISSFSELIDKTEMTRITLCIYVLALLVSLSQKTYAKYGTAVHRSAFLEMLFTSAGSSILFSVKNALAKMCTFSHGGQNAKTKSSQ